MAGLMAKAGFQEVVGATGPVNGGFGAATSPAGFSDVNTDPGGEKKRIG